jgi:RNA-directed DNA polymerase
MAFGMNPRQFERLNPSFHRCRPASEHDENGKRRLTGGKDHHCGTPQGGVVSPVLANLYMNRLLKGWRNTKRGEQFQARVVSYADDFVILSRGKAAEALDWTRKVTTRLGLTLNEAKTSIKQARNPTPAFAECMHAYVLGAGLLTGGWAHLFGSPNNFEKPPDS